MTPPDLMPSLPEWERLTIDPDKRRALASDLYFRECWADLVELAGADAIRLLGSTALLNVKPDAVVGRRMTPVLDFTAAHGFVPIAAAPMRLTRHSMRELWRLDWHVYPVDRLAFSTFWYTSADVLLFLLRDARPEGSLTAAARLCRLKGSALPERRRPGDLRTVLRPPNQILNFVHVADEPGDLVRELGIFLDRPERRALLVKIASGEAADRSGEVRDEIARLEARCPAHDLDPQASLARLQRSSALTPAAAGRLSAMIASGEKLGWDALCRMIDPTAQNVDRWDFIAVASSVIWLERAVG